MLLFLIFVYSACVYLPNEIVDHLRGNALVQIDDPDVRAMQVRCGKEDDPPGVGMPAVPNDPAKFYTKQEWTASGDLKVQVWKFTEPGHQLKGVYRSVKDNLIQIEPDWIVPNDGPLAMIEISEQT